MNMFSDEARVAVSAINIMDSCLDDRVMHVIDSGQHAPHPCPTCHRCPSCGALPSAVPYWQWTPQTLDMGPGSLNSYHDGHYTVNLCSAVVGG